MIRTGIGPLAPAGLISIIGISTVIAGSAELSTWPTTLVAVTGTGPTFSASEAVTVQLTPGAPTGTRPRTSRSKPSTISARRLGHIAGVVTRRPSFMTRGSGQSGKGLALASS